MAELRAKRTSTWLLPGVMLAALASAAHAGDNNAAKAPAPAQPTDAFSQAIANNPFSVILEGPKLWTTPPDPKDWVKATRSKKELEYMPTGVTPQPHATKVKSAAELAAAKAELDAARAAMAQAAAQKPVLTSIGPPPAAPAAAAAPAKPLPRKPVRAASNRGAKPLLPAAAPVTSN
ncbi:MAG: hypothetical protein JO366_13115 [Methylobacteriaceae bacterium]|nr:hypothetical protein [Methylobacteriaceae bacterium]MBV9245743.1 hypothetical protein [Methylobacteriaceae bacterium]MBV9637710.1 hypothetical protein [Methylobacteriaceae bacterium]MBV9704807.1 hypothetical protein [Methylobacteriaceae bacterium]